MKQTFRQTLLVATVFALFILLHNTVAFADNSPLGKTTLSGTLYCITTDGKIHGTEGGCPDAPQAYVFITDSGVVYSLSKSTEISELISRATQKVNRLDKVRTKVSQDQLMWWQRSM